MKKKVYKKMPDFGKLPNYVKAFGFSRGLRVYFNVEILDRIKYSADVCKININKDFGIVYSRNTQSDLAIFWQVFVKQEYDLGSFPHANKLYEKYRRVIDQGCFPLIFDFGANVGFATRWFHGQFPGAYIYSVEPENNNYELLLKNVGSSKNLSAIHGAIWFEPALLEIENPESGSSSFRMTSVESEANSNTIRAFTVNELLDKADSKEALIVKIDIEGGESALFGENTEWIDKVDLLIVETHDWLFPWQAMSSTFFKVMSEKKFEILFKGENVFCFNPGLNS